MIFKLFEEEESKTAVEPTLEEQRNGWTAAKLTAYLSEREAAQSRAIDPDNRKIRPIMQNHGYNPLRWRQ